MEKGLFSKKMLVGSLIIGFLYSVIGEFIYQRLIGHIASIIVVGVYFMGLFLFLGSGIFLCGKFIYHRTDSRINKKQWFATAVSMIVLTLLFEFIYELDRSQNLVEEPDSYIFVIDDSGSMDDTDPEGIRYDTLVKLLESKQEEFPYAVYTFSNAPRLVRPMREKGKVVETIDSENSGGTAIRGSLEQILIDLDHGILTFEKKSRMILLSDGYATDIGFFNKGNFIKRLEEFPRHQISISTIGMLRADDELMGLIADKTGGVYVKVDDVNNLEQAMIDASQKHARSRNLLGYRNSFYANNLFAVLRIVFITILGILVGIQKTILCETFLDTSAVWQSSLIASVLAGFSIELGMNMLGVSPTLMRILTCLLIAFTLLREEGRGIDTTDGSVLKINRHWENEHGCEG